MRPRQQFRYDLLVWVGRAGAKAIAGCQLEAVPDLMCHFHFLATVGRKLLDIEYAARQAVRQQSAQRPAGTAARRATAGRSATRSRRADPVGPRRHRPEGPPVSLRLAALGFLPPLRTVPAPGAELGARAGLGGTSRARIQWAVPRLERSWAVFCELRSVLRRRDSKLPRGSRTFPPAGGDPAATAARWQAIETAGKAYRAKLSRQAAAQRPEAVVLTYLDRYRDGLFGHPVARAPAGRVLAVVDRTNNVAEHFFAIAEQKLRRRLGRAHLGRDMEDQPAKAALAANLLCPEYVQIVCGTLDRLPQDFAALDCQTIPTATPLERNNKDAALRKCIRAWAAADGG